MITHTMSVFLPLATDGLGLVGVGFAAPPLLLVIGLVVMMLRDRLRQRE